ncbi:sodium channel subunit beta-2-like [Boleophthalmus pectinirostris]|uniref:sodium channel subunit beta-2-like n=1 Tax=Boleophthalmus pectinirostris TaxID=150288 RepID=UPI000A1C4BFD|nr:sodium channel subunit beta-2-like [Boleophthalmus pectinirostris]
MRSENMLLLAWVLELLVPCSAQEQMLRIEAKCGSDADLPCNADFRTNKYFSLTWYKNKKEGIIRIALEDKKRRYYNFSRNVSIDEQSYSLLLPKLMPEDSGIYECAVSARPGGQNLYLKVELTVPECDVTPALLTTVKRGETERTHAPHLPLVWTVVGYSAVGLTKIILSLMIVWVFHICTRRKRRSWSHLSKK